MKLNNLIILMLSVSVCCFAGGQNELPSVDPANTGAELVNTYRLPGYQIFSVSPDGKHFAATTSDRKILVIADLATQEVVLQTGDEIDNFALDYFEWSPDGSKAVYTENLLQHQKDSDLWIMDLEEKQIRHLFADDIADVFSGRMGGEGYAEYQPSWSPDGSAIFLSRLSYSDGNCRRGTVSDLSEGSFSPIPELTSDIVYSSWSGAFWRDDYIYYTEDNPGRGSDPSDGIYRIPALGGRPELVKGGDPQLGELMVCDVDLTERRAVAVHTRFMVMGAPPSEEDSYWRLIDLKTSECITLPKAEEGIQHSVFGAIFSPSGNSILTVSRDTGKRQTSLELRDAEDGIPFTIFSCGENTDNGFLIGTNFLRYKPPVFWTDDNRLFVVADIGLTLLELKLTAK